MTTIADVHAYVDADLVQSMAASDGVSGELAEAHQLAQSTLASVEQLRDAVLQQIAARAGALDSLERRIALGESTLLPALAQLSTDIEGLTSALVAVPQVLQAGHGALAEAATARTLAISDGAIQVAGNMVPAHAQSLTALVQQDLPATVEQARTRMMEGRGAAETVALRAQSSAMALQQMLPEVTDRFVIGVGSARDSLGGALASGADDLVAQYGQRHSTLAEQVDAHASSLAGSHGEALDRVTDQLGRVRESVDKLKAVVSIASAVSW
jgi:hypothetical protein